MKLLAKLSLFFIDLLIKFFGINESDYLEQEKSNLYVGANGKLYIDELRIIKWEVQEIQDNDIFGEIESVESLGIKKVE